MAVVGAQAQITAAVVSWEGVKALPHRIGSPESGTEYRLGKKREIGHIHGDDMVDIPFPTAIRIALVRTGKAQPHHLLKDSGWVSFYLQQPEDVDHAISLFRRSYEIARKQMADPTETKSD